MRSYMKAEIGTIKSEFIIKEGLRGDRQGCYNTVHSKKVCAPLHSCPPLPAHNSLLDFIYAGVLLIVHISYDATGRTEVW